MIFALAAIAAAIWVYLLVARGAFWLTAERQEHDLPRFDGPWPAVVAIVPARDEAETIAAAIGSLLAQDYAGALDVVLVDDGSADETAESGAAGPLPRRPVRNVSRLSKGWRPRPAGPERSGRSNRVFAWSPAGRNGPPTCCFSDADIAHDASSVRDLVTRAEVGGQVLVSAMARLRCASFAERCAIPAFVYFFRMLYPFQWVNRPDHKTAAAAGGCMLVRPGALERRVGLPASAMR